MRLAITTIEYLRSLVEHLEGKNAAERILLTKGMRVGIHANQKLKHLCHGYQNPKFWQEVWELPDTLGLKN